MNSSRADPEVGIVILNWNNIELTNELLKSVRMVDYPRKHIYVVDNGSENEEGAHLRKTWAPMITLIQNPTNVGFAKGANIGVLHALTDSCELVLLINNDTIVDPLFLRNLVRVMINAPRIAIAGPLVLSFESPDRVLSAGGGIDFKRARARLLGQGELKDEYLSMRPFDTEYVSGACMLVRASVFRKVGLLPEQYFAYFEETEFCTRVIRNGYRVVVAPCSFIWHHSDNPSLRKLPSRDKLMMRNRVLFLIRNGRLSQSLSFFVAFAPFEFGSSLVSLVLKGRTPFEATTSLLRGLLSGIAAAVRNPRGEGMPAYDSSRAESNVIREAD